MGTPKFTVEWESRWQEFWTSVPVVLHRIAPGTPRNHVQTGIRLRGPAAMTALEFTLALFLLRVGPAVLGPATSPSVQLKSGFENYTIYYVPQDLPNVSDVNGAEEGRSGKTGGAHAYHPRQVIRIARGHTPVTVVADAPTLRLPVTKDRTSNLLAMLGGSSAARVLPATPDVNALKNRTNRAPQAEVVPAPPSLAEVRTRNMQQQPTVSVVQPPPAVTALAQKHEAPPSALVVPPPPAVTSLSQARGEAPAATVVAPAPTITGQRAKGLASLGNIEVAAPANRVATGAGKNAGTGAGANGTSGGANGTAKASAVILSAEAGNTVGMPAGATPGVASMSSTGGNTAGAGGHGGVTGAGIGSGSGRGTAGEAVGSGKNGNGYGSDPLAHGGISASAGPGGADVGRTPRAASGVVISGGVVNIPSFGSSSEPPSPRHSMKEKNNPPAVMIIATSRSGGGLAEYGVLHGGRVYTTYLSTSQGNVVLQFADPSARGTDMDLTPPQLINSNFPSEQKLLRTVISCVLEPTGTLKNVRVLDTATPELTAAVIRYLDNWRFRPALRGDKAVAVQAILAFGITTQ